MTDLRERLFAHIRAAYGTEPEYLWSRFPGYAVFRHRDNDKWFALVMDVPADRLGLPGRELRNILNVKLADSMLAETLTRKEGYRKGYHIRRGNWISILLDGTVPFEEVCGWLEESYMNTASREEREKRRPPKDWIIPANPAYYDVQAAFAREKEIDWKQGRGIKKGDTVYMYLAAPVSSVLYKCLVTETDIPFRYEDGRVRMKALMRIRLLREYPTGCFSFERLGREFGIRAVRGPRGIPSSLKKALEA